MKQYLSTKAAAAHIGHAEGTMANMRWRGAGPPYIRVGRRILYDVADLDAWLAAQRVDPEAQTKMT